MAERSEEMRRAARKLAGRFAEPCVEPAVGAWLSTRPAFPRLLVACSGGADSTALLCLLWAHFPENREQIVVAHYNHRWRGEAAEGDAAFVAALAAALGLDCAHGERPEEAEAFTETSARELRQAFLRSLSLERRAEAIAFGHQRDDILETQLQRLARGSGSEGLSAPRPVQVMDGAATHLRPLLHLSGREIRDALAACGMPWREDASNADRSIVRNALRHTVIPELVKILPQDPVAGAARSRRRLEEDAAALNALARERMPEAFAGAVRLDRKRLRALPPALGRRVVSAWLAAHGLLESLSATAVDTLVEDCCSVAAAGRHSAGEAFVVVDADSVSVAPREAAGGPDPVDPVRLCAGERVTLGGCGTIEAAALELGTDLRKRIRSGVVDSRKEAYIALDQADERFVLRNWCAGDRFQPLGAPGGRKLQDWFTDRRIPAGERKGLPLVCTPGGEVLWIPGFAPAESRKIEPGTKQALRLTYITRNPL